MGNEKEWEVKMKPRLWDYLTRKREMLLTEMEGVHAGREGLGWKAKKFDLGHVQFQVAMGQPRRNVGQAVADVRLEGRGEFWSSERDVVCHRCRCCLIKNAV